MNTPKTLWGDLTSPQEKIEFIESGRAVETGILASAVADDLCKTFKRLVSATEALESIVRNVPCMHAGGCFYSMHGPEGEYLGEQNVDPLSVIGSMAQIASDALHQIHTEDTKLDAKIKAMDIRFADWVRANSNLGWILCGDKNKGGFETNDILQAKAYWLFYVDNIR